MKLKTKCLICGKEFETFMELKIHLTKDSFCDDECKSIFIKTSPYRFIKIFKKYKKNIIPVERAELMLISSCVDFIHTALVYLSDFCAYFPYLYHLLLFLTLLVSAYPLYLSHTLVSSSWVDCCSSSSFICSSLPYSFLAHTSDSDSGRYCWFHPLYWYGGRRQYSYL